MMQAVEDGDDIREIKRVQKPLNASPTTPFQFEAGTYYNPVVLEEVQRSIQLQLLSHMNNFGGYNHLQQQQQQQQACTWRSESGVPVFVQQQQQQQQAFYSQQQLGRQFHCKPPAASPQHSTIALLQQRFQRLERDKGMRQAKRLHHPNKLPVPAAAIPSYLSANLEASSLVDASNSRKQSSLPSEAENWLQRTSSSKSEDHGRSSMNMNSEEDTIFDRPSTSDFPLSARMRTSEESLRSCSAYDNMLPCATRSFLRNWNDNAGVKHRSIRPESDQADDEVDTTLHL